MVKLSEFFPQPQPKIYHKMFCYCVGFSTVERTNENFICVYSTHLTLTNFNGQHKCVSKIENKITNKKIHANFKRTNRYLVSNILNRKCDREIKSRIVEYYLINFFFFEKLNGFNAISCVWFVVIHDVGETQRWTIKAHTNSCTTTQKNGFFHIHFTNTHTFYCNTKLFLCLSLLSLNLNSFFK